jgi:hypothetical protein
MRKSEHLTGMLNSVTVRPETETAEFGTTHLRQLSWIFVVPTYPRKVAC